MNSNFRLLGLVLLTTLFAMTTDAQQKLLTLEDLNFGGRNYAAMRPQSRTLCWWGDRLVRTEADQCSEIDKARGTETPLFTRADLGRDAEGMPLTGARFPYPGRTLCLLTGGGHTRLFDWKRHTTLADYTTEGAVAQAWDKTSRIMAVVRGDDLWLSLPDGTERRITRDGSREIVYGQAVHRSEWGIDGGLFWSPDGRRLAFYRMDQSMVADYPQVNTFTREATLEPDKYPMAGETSHKVTVGVYDVATRRTVYLQAGDPTDRYFTNISWSPDGGTVYMFELNRDQNDCRLVSYDATSGARMAELYRERDGKYVEPLHPIRFLPWDSGKFILQSQRDGYNHLYLFSKDGREIRQITRGAWVVKDIVGFDTRRRRVLITSTERSPLQQNVFAVDVTTGERTLRDATGGGWHRATLSEGGGYLLDCWQAPDTPRAYTIVRLADGKRTPYVTAPDPWQGYTVPLYEQGTIKAADGVTDLYWRMVKPADFDPSKKYPTIVYVYGGPHAHCVDATWHWGSRSWETYMAGKGYILFILDNRGSENRGKAFEQVTFRHLGVEEMKDQMRGVDYLRSLPYVDASRLGVHGWSFGGFMTISLMTTYPGVFKAGVAGGPVIDWKWYEVMYGERYMDTPQTNPEGYAGTSLLGKAKNLKGKLQIIIGMNDPTVVPQHALGFLDAAAEAGTQPDFFVYPGQGHNMTGHRSVHLHERITQYFEDWLKPVR